jgi:predicted enzyme related to lactoylglutathione lyase
LVVIRASDIEAARDFYTSLGLSFTKHAHGKGPVHYASETGAIVFEIYPQANDEQNTGAVRIGFRVDDVAAVIARTEQAGAKIISPPTPSPWGLRAVIQDPFGHKVELLASVEANPSSRQT